MGGFNTDRIEFLQQSISALQKVNQSLEYELNTYKSIYPPAHKIVLNKSTDTGDV